MRGRMSGARWFWLFLILLGWPSAWAQHVSPTSPTAQLRNIEQRTWHIFGKVTDLNGQPLHGARVRVDIGSGNRYVRELTTDLHGAFRTEYTLDAGSFASLSVTLTATREGYHPAREFAEFGARDQTWEIDLAMQPEGGQPEELSVAAFANQMARRIRAGGAQEAAKVSAGKDFERAAHYFLEEQNPLNAIPSFAKVVKRCPGCIQCRMLLGLTLLNAGSWNSATRELTEAAKLALAAGSAAVKVDTLLTLAALENWKGQYAKAAGFLMQAKDLDPKNAFVLQELGRTLIFQENWESADDYLKKALDAGAPKQALLLRARAMLEEGDALRADALMREYVGSASLKSFPLPVRALYAQVQARKSLQSFAEERSVVSEPLPALLKDVPELTGLVPASSQAQLASILQKAGENVRAFFGNFQNTVSLEEIHEERLGRDGKVKDSLDERFQYLLLSHPEEQRLGLEEFRTDFRGDRKAPTGLSSGLMVSTGFATACLLFHPAYQAGSTFRYLGQQRLGTRLCHVVAFAQNPERAQMVERFNADGGPILVLLQGLAWIDAESYRMTRLRTDLLKPQPKIRLERQTAEITYSPVRFKQSALEMWLPTQVALTVEWRGKTYRNLHRYSDFRLFSTETRENVHPASPPGGISDCLRPPAPRPKPSSAS